MRNDTAWHKECLCNMELYLHPQDKDDKQTKKKNQTTQYQWPQKKKEKSYTVQCGCITINPEVVQYDRIYIQVT